MYSFNSTCGCPGKAYWLKSQVVNWDLLQQKFLVLQYKKKSIYW